MPARRLPHPVPDHFPAAEFNFIPVTPQLRDQVALNLDKKLSIRQPNLVPDGGPEHLGVLAARGREVGGRELREGGMGGFSTTNENRGTLAAISSPPLWEKAARRAG